MEAKRKVYLPLGMFVLICVGGWLTLNGTAQGSCSYNSQDIRPLYFGCEFQRDWLSELPQMPPDFYDIRGLFQYGFIEFDGKAINRSYWIHPEWFSNFDENLNTIRDYAAYQEETGRIKIVLWSSGIYPSEFYVGPVRPGDSVTAYTWIKNVPIQWKNTGFRLEEYYPSHIKIENIKKDLGFDEVSQEPTYAADNLHMDFSPREFLLTPAYPNITKGYARMIRVDVNVSDDIEPGRYIVGFVAAGPSEKFSQAMYERYGFKYTDPTSGEFAASPRHYNLIIEVEDDGSETILTKIIKGAAKGIVEEFDDE
jgi:hypothetical protein